MKKKQPRVELTPANPGSKRVTRNSARQQDQESAAPSKVESRLAFKASPFDGYCDDVRRNPDFQSTDADPALEETLLAFSDAPGVREDTDDVEEDKLMFLEVTHARFCRQGDSTIPSRKMFKAIFHQVENSHSAELTMASFQLLIDLEKRHSRVAVKEEWNDSTGKMTRKLDIDEKVWSPLEETINELRAVNRLRTELSEESRVPLNLITLVGTIAEETRKVGWHDQTTRTDGLNYLIILGQFQMLQHLVNLIERDLYCRFQVFEETSDASLVRKSYFYELLSESRRSLRNAFISNLVFILNPDQQQAEEETENERHNDVTPSTTVADAAIRGKSGPLPSRIDFSQLAYKLLLMVVEIDGVIKKWTAGDSRSTRKCSFLDDDFTAFNDPKVLEVFLQAIECPWTKLRFIVDYFLASAPKGITAEGLRDPIDYGTMEKLISCFEGDILKFVYKFRQDVLPSLLAHAFQAFLIVHAEAILEAGKDERAIQKSKFSAICRSLVDILTELRVYERQAKLLPVAEYALETATSMLTDP